MHHAGRLLAAASVVLLLAACGGGGMMSSYDEEKNRIRGLLSSEVQCTESNQIMECRGFEGTLRLGLSGPPVSMSASHEWTGGSLEMVGSQQFERLAAAYGLDRAKFEKCRAEGRFAEQHATHHLLCTIEKYPQRIVVAVTGQKRV